MSDALGLLAYGVAFPTRGRAYADLTPIVSMLVAVVLARLVLGLRLTSFTIVLAAFCGALWAYLAEPWGLVAPTALAAFGLIVAAGVLRRRRTEALG